MKKNYRRKEPKPRIPTAKATIVERRNKRIRREEIEEMEAEWEIQKALYGDED